jgi:glucosamine-6-phosphate deaminase
MAEEIRSFVVDKLKVSLYPDRKALGRASGRAVADAMRELARTRDRLTMVFAAAPSQNEFLEELSSTPGLPWNRVTAFHLDEYVGLPATAPQGFGNFLRTRLFDKVQPGIVHYLDGQSPDPETECRRYGGLIAGRPFDIACIGIGENGHLAFNDPPVADFADPKPAKVIDLELTSREQQVHDGCFPDLASVPTRAMTLTLPTIVSARYVYCMVPAPTKAEAVKKTLKGPVSTACPASILRGHDGATLFLDPDSAQLLESGK